MAHTPPKPRAAPLAATSRSASSLGRNSSTAVLLSSVSAHWGYHVGHTGKSVRVLVK